MSVTFSHPEAAAVALVGLVPVIVSLARARAAERLRSELGLPRSPLRARLARPLALACAFALLGLAIAQPSIRRQHERLARTDAQLLVVLDSSRSMLAAPGPGGRPRYRRAAAFARRLHAELPELAAGVGSLSNRVLPYLFPTVDDRAYQAVLDQSYGVQRPPPALDTDRWVTSFDKLSEVAVRRFFAPSVRKRLVVVLSDAETRPFDAVGVLRTLRQAHVTPIVVRFWRPGERIPGDSYRATQQHELADLRASGWPAYPETAFGRVVARIQQTLGTGPVAQVGYQRRDTSIAPIVALAALAPFLLVLAPAGQLRIRPARSRWPSRRSGRRRPGRAAPAPRRPEPSRSPS
jgi:hypothetical protein